MVSLRVKRTLGHTKIGLLWGFNLKFSSSIPAAPFIGKSPRACLFLVAFDWPYSWIELHCVVPENIHTHPLPPPTEGKGNSTPASRLPTRKKGKDRDRLLQATKAKPVSRDILSESNEYLNVFITSRFYATPHWSWLVSRSFEWQQLLRPSWWPRATSRQE